MTSLVKAMWILGTVLFVVVALIVFGPLDALMAILGRRRKKKV